MNIAYWIRQLFWGDETEEYLDRFIRPQINRLRELDVSDDDSWRLYQQALRLADPFTIGLAPGNLLRDMVDHIEAGKTVDEVLNS